jgi:hypothetical protein
MRMSAWEKVQIDARDEWQKLFCRKMLESRFGPLTQEQLQKLNNATTQQLQTLMASTYQATTVSELPWPI